MRVSDLHRRILAQKVPLLLDLFPNAAAAFSLRKLRSDYTGNCIEVRRSSDNALQNIGFVNNVLDTASLLSFVGAGSGFVRTWYDQSGSGNDVIQTKDANQPQIVANEVVQQKNVKPTLDFNGISHRLTFIGNFLGGIAGSGFAVSSFDNNTSPIREMIYGLQDLTGTRFDFVVIRQGTNFLPGLTPNIVDFYVEGNFSVASKTITDTNQHIYSNFYQNNVTRSLFIDGIQTLNGTNNLGILDDGTDFIIGMDIINEAYIDGKIQEIIIYPSNQSANRTPIESNINSFYNIY
jgi:hypothetical protein